MRKVRYDRHVIGDYTPYDDEEEKDSGNEQDPEDIGKEWVVIEDSTQDQSKQPPGGGDREEVKDGRDGEAPVKLDGDWTIVDEIRNSPEKEETKCETLDEPPLEEDTKNAEVIGEGEDSEESEKEQECTEGEEFTRSVLDFQNNVYYEPLEQNHDILDLAKAESLEDCLRFFVKSEHLTDEYF